jgi:hypothetical protein
MFIASNPMNSTTRITLLCTTTIAPGLFFAGVSTHYLFQDWAALDRSFQRFAKLSQSPDPTVPQLLIAKAAEDRHRVNCFAEGIGVLAGWGIAAIGIHSLCMTQALKSKI